LIPNKSIHQITTEEIASRGSSKIKNSTLVLLDECGHFVQYEKPDEFNAQLISFFKINFSASKKSLSYSIKLFGNFFN